ncbi:MAG TPA: zinc-dependent metalloprotease, partial [Bacteroidetes bacterium]|nr:zinc-dependent metalloprotease [Bacteroidota bacterium]
QQQSSNGPGGPGGPGGSSEKDKKIKPYDKVVTKEAVSDSGLFIVHRIDERVLFEIPNTELGKELLLVTRVSRTPRVGYGGEESNTDVVRWDRKYDRILLRTVSHVNVAADTLPIARAVKAANFEEVIKSFPVQALGKDSASVVIDVTDLFTTDVGILAPNRDIRRDVKTTMLDKERSFVEYV